MFGLFGTRDNHRQPRSRRHLGDVSVTYAIGDVHGCHQQLVALLDIIRRDAMQFKGRKLLVTLGDLIDRGPRSASVLDWLTEPFWPDFERISLCGNHEAMMLDFLARPGTGTPWLDNGGWQTLESYGINLAAFSGASRRNRQAMLDAAIPHEHIEMLRSMPALATTSQAIFVHAGIRPGVAIDAQSDDDLLWIRQPFLGTAFTDGPYIVHGHTPSTVPVFDGRRICVDTGAYATGILTAVRLTDEGTMFLQADSNSARTQNSPTTRRPGD